MHSSGLILNVLTLVVARVLFPLLHSVNDKTIARVLYLYYIQNFIEQFSPYLAKISEHDSKGQCVPRRGGGGVEWCGDPWVALVPFPLPHPGNDKTIAPLHLPLQYPKLYRAIFSLSRQN